MYLRGVPRGGVILTKTLAANLPEWERCPATKWRRLILGQVPVSSALPRQLLFPSY